MVLSLAAMVAVGVMAWPFAQSDQPGWGQSAAEAVHWQAIADTLIAPANACGLGASSCFQCHSGRRAEKPKSDPETAPWHYDHANVDHSCGGCHNGNERIMREDMAHRGMRVDPREDPQASCASCHRDAAELEDLLSRY